MCSSLTRGAANQPTELSLFRCRRIWVLTLLVILMCGAALLPPFGGTILVGNDPLPSHADVAVMLAGSDSAEEVRLAATMRMLQEGRVDHVMLTVGRVTFLGEWLPDLLWRYVSKKYGAEVTRKAALCEVSNVVDSTAEEAVALRRCLEAQGWRSVIVVTSNYHTRRARLIWRATLAKSEPPFKLSVWGVSDGDFEPNRWWQKRRYAKTWLLELTKLAWTVLFENPRAGVADRSTSK